MNGVLGELLSAGTLVFSGGTLAVVWKAAHSYGRIEEVIEDHQRQLNQAVTRSEMGMMQEAYQDAVSSLVSTVNSRMSGLESQVAELRQVMIRPPVVGGG